MTRAESLAINRALSPKGATPASLTGVTCSLSYVRANEVGGCSSPVPTVTPSVPWLYQSGQAVDPGEIEQRLPINIKFPSAVRTVMLSSTGALSCNGTLGRMVGFRNNVQVVQADNVLIDPSDCGADSVTYGVQGALPSDVEIDSLVIEGVNPWTFEVLGTCCGRALLNYTIQYQPTLACDAVTRGQTATCLVNVAVEAVTGWQFDGKLDSVVAGQLDSLHISSASASLSWSGIVVLPGKVSAFVTLNGISDTLEALLTVRPRSSTTWSWSEANWTFRQNGPPICTYPDFVAKKPTRLGVNRRTSGCEPITTYRGHIDPSVITARDSGFTAAQILGGPNDSLWYVVTAHYFMDRTSEMNPFIGPSGRADTLTNSTDQRVCRRALGLGNNDPVVVNFYTYNTTCRAFSLTPMFDGLWSHEGFGTKPPLDSSMANGHEARGRIAARDPANDPYRIVESMVETSFPNLSILIGQSVFDADERIGDLSDPNHAFVRNNYVQGNKCGEAWVFNDSVKYYVKGPVVQTLANGQQVCF